MLRVLHGLEAGHITIGLIFLVFLVFIASPLLKHMAFRRMKGGYSQPDSIHHEHPDPERKWTPGQVRQARRLLQQNGGGKPPAADPEP